MFHPDVVQKFRDKRERSKAKWESMKSTMKQLQSAPWDTTKNMALSISQKTWTRLSHYMHPDMVSAAQNHWHNVQIRFSGLKSFMVSMNTHPINGLKVIGAQTWNFGQKPIKIWQLGLAIAATFIYCSRSPSKPKPNLFAV